MAYRPLDHGAAAVRKVRTQESGQGLVEYALILVLIAIATIATLTILGTNLNATIETIADVFP